MTAFSEDARQLGDYRLIELVAEGPQTRSWLAEQISVGRKVLVDELKPEMLEHRQEFLAQARAKAAMRHPFVASVYEAVSENGYCLYAHEYLPGVALAARVAAGAAMKPAELAMILRKIAEVQLHYEAQQRSSTPIRLEHIRIDEHAVMRIDNLALDAARGPDEGIRDMEYLGRAMLPLVADGKTGATRLLTLLSWMRGEELENHLGWHEMIDLCERIEKQLTDPLMTNPLIPGEDGMVDTGSKPVALIALLVILGVAIVVVVAMRLTDGEEKVSRERVKLPPPVSVTPQGGSSLKPFRMAAHEVTIGEYQQFLKTLDALKANKNENVFNHRDQPAAKTSHLPDDWEAMLNAALTGKPWKGRRVTLDTPVVGVDWWDATAYAEWKRGRLPTYDDWLAALGMPPEQVATIALAGWGSVDPASKDRSGLGVLNMCGSVSEWLGEPMASPTNPLGDKKWVVVGGSYLQQGSHALTRDWVDSRDLRRPDLGFRLVFTDR